MRVFEQSAYADRAFQGEAAALDRRERQQAMHLAYGATQRRGTLDFWIETLAERPLERLDAEVRAALRLGLYELVFSDGAADHATVSQAVSIAAGAGGGGGRSARAQARGGLVNALLRRAATERDALLAALDDSTPEGAAIAHSLPLWVVESWWSQLGPARARSLAAACNQPAEMALRVNSLRGDSRAARRLLPARMRSDAVFAEALIAEEPFDLTASGAWRQGLVVAQSRAAMLAAPLLDPQPGERVLDLCAAPGGKSSHLAALMRGRGELVAVESNRAKAGALARTLRRLGARNATVVHADARLGLPSGSSFDRVLVDPPCSGLGTLQSKPDLRWRLEQSDPERLATLQLAILRCGAQVLRPGGRLLYSTCTISAIENQRVIEAFLDRHPDFELQDLGARWPALALSVAGLDNDGGGSRAMSVGGNRVGDVEEGAHGRGEEAHAARMLQTLPDRDHTAGFFYAALCRAS